MWGLIIAGVGSSAALSRSSHFVRSNLSDEPWHCHHAPCFGHLGARLAPRPSGLGHSHLHQWLVFWRYFTRVLHWAASFAVLRQLAGIDSRLERPDFARRSRLFLENKNRAQTQAQPRHGLATQLCRSFPLESWPHCRLNHRHLLYQQLFYSFVFKPQSPNPQHHLTAHHFKPLPNTSIHPRNETWRSLSLRKTHLCRHCFTAVLGISRFAQQQPLPCKAQRRHDWVWRGTLNSPWSCLCLAYSILPSRSIKTLQPCS